MSPVDVPEWLTKYHEMSAQERQRFHARAALEHAEQVYSERRNPVHAWDGYREARRAGDPLPEWILAYLDRVGLAISRAARKHRKAMRPIGDVLAEALEFRAGGRRGAVNLLQEIGRKGHEIEVASEFYLVLLAEPQGKMQALKRIAMERHLSRCNEQPRCALTPNTVENYWKTHMHLFIATSLDEWRSHRKTRAVPK